MSVLAHPRLRDLFDLRFLLALGLLGLVAFQACDLVNRKLDVRFNPGSITPKPKQWVEGATLKVGITVVTKDADRLACASDKVFDSSHCEFQLNKQRWPKAEGAIVDDNGVDLVVPYRTTVGNHLVFVTGMWNTPALAFRRHREPARSITEAKLKRFTALCDLHFIGHHDSVELRWDYSKPWYTERDVAVARAIDCSVE
jgi:hypothetical protein